MGFSWISVSEGTKIDDLIVDRIQDNITTLLVTDLQSSDYEWSFDADEFGNDIEYAEQHMDEIKAAVIQADELNYCRTHYLGHNLHDFRSYDISKDASLKTGVLSTHDSTIQSSHYTSANTSNYSSRLGYHNTSHDAAKQITVQTDQRTGLLANENTSYLGLDNTNENISHDSTINSSDNSVDFRSHDTSVCPSHYITQEGFYRSVRQDSAMGGNLYTAYSGYLSTQNSSYNPLDNPCVVCPIHGGAVNHADIRQ